MAGIEPYLERAGDADGVDADVAAEALVFDRDHGRAHLGRDLVVRQPAAETGTERNENLAVCRPDPYHLAKVGTLFELGITGQLAVGDADEDREEHEARDASSDEPLEDSHQGRAP